MQDVAIKQMKSTKSKEFFSELNILCRVHHTNLVFLVFVCGRKVFFFLRPAFTVDCLHLSLKHSLCSYLFYVFVLSENNFFLYSVVTFIRLSSLDMRLVETLCFWYMNLPKMVH